MPLTRIDLRRGKSVEYRRAIMDQIYAALRETFDVPDEDRFMVLTEHDADNFNYSRRYLGIDRSEDFVLIQLTVSNTRTLTQKQALYRSITKRLAAAPGIRSEDVFVNLVEVVKENWSFGNGKAQYAATAAD